MENHSFDNLLGMVPYQVPGAAGGRRSDAATRGRFKNVNRDTDGNERVRRARRLAVPARRPPRPELERQPPVLRRRPQRRLREGQRTDCDALLGPARPAVHLLARQAFPDRRALLLLGARADLSQPPVLLRRHGVGDHRHRQHDVQRSRPTNGTIFDRLDAHHIDWADLLPERAELADRARHRSTPRAAPTASASTRPSTPTWRPGDFPRSRSSIPTTTPRPRRTRRTSRSASGSSPTSSAR